MLLSIEGMGDKLSEGMRALHLEPRHLTNLRSTKWRSLEIWSECYFENARKSFAKQFYRISPKMLKNFFGVIGVNLVILRQYGRNLRWFFICPRCKLPRHAFLSQKILRVYQSMFDPRILVYVVFSTKEWVNFDPNFLHPHVNGHFYHDIPVSPRWKRLTLMKPPSGYGPGPK